jgi:MtfA peptidase
LLPLILIISTVLSLAIGIPLYHKKRRNNLMNQNVPESWPTILKDEFPLLKFLNPKDKESLMGLIHIFLDEVQFIGCNKLEIDERIRVTIAAQACLLTLHNPTQKHFNKLNTIYVYPSTFSSQVNEANHGIISESDSARLGQSSRGSIVLAWDSCRQGASNYQDGHNVIFHEFAHQLDQETGPADGIPILQERSAYLDWGRIMYKQFLKLRKNKEQRRKTLIDTYGALNEAEFFAVCTECFFEKPKQLHKKHPEVYRVLHEYYGLDPKTWN